MIGRADPLVLAYIGQARLHFLMELVLGEDSEESGAMEVGPPMYRRLMGSVPQSIT